MSGDVQPRKRKDKRRKKDEFTSEPVLGKRSLSTESDGEESHEKKSTVEKDENIHVHHDHGIGGNAFVKIIFFALLAVLLGLVGLIFIESRGSTDVDLPSIEESRFAEYFTGWLDDSPDDHGHDDPALSGEADDEHDHDDHDEHEGHSDEPEDEEEGHSEAEDDEEDAAGTEEDHQEDETSEEPPVDSNAEDEDSEEAENTAEEDENDTEEGDSGAQDDNDDEEEPENDSADEEENNESVEVENDGSEIDEDDDNNSEIDEDDDNNSADGDDDDDEEEEEEEDEEYDLTQEDESIEEPKVVVKSKVKSVEDSKDKKSKDEDDSKMDDDNDEEKDDDEDSKDDEKASIEEKSVENEQPILPSSDEESVEEIEESEEALKEEEEAVKKEKISLMDDDEDLSDISDVKLRRKREKELVRKLEKMLKEQEKKTKMDEDEEEGGDDNNEEDGEEAKETGGVALKLGVGVALVITAHVVLVRRWRALTTTSIQADEETQDEEKDINNTTENEETEPVVSRRQTLIPESAEIPNDDYEDEEIEEEYSDDEEIVETPIKRRTSVDVKLERQDATKYYTKEELGDSEDLEDEEELLGDEEEELEEEELGEEEEDEDYELERSQTPSDLGDPEEEYEEDEDELEPPPPPRANVPSLRRGPQDNDLDEQTDNVEFEEILVVRESNAADDFEDDKEFLEESAENKLDDKNDDWLFRQELNFADDQLLNNPQTALDAYSRIIEKSTGNLRALIGRAKALDSLAHERRSNALLGQAVDEYQKLLTESKFKLNDTQFKELASQCIKRMKFAGRNLQSVVIYEAVIKRFPEEIEHRNGLAISYLMAGRNNQAYKVLEDTLKKWPNDGVALVHIGFILKNSMGRLEEGAKMLKKGLRTNHTGTLDGRFFFHLGDALHRLGRNDEAFNWYELGVEKGLFKSKYQRSLYNVDRLKARPWWSLEDTTYHQFFRNLEKNWQKIREEGMTLLRARETKLFQDEAENLKDTGDWKQLDLYSRGRKQSGCARAPFTCQLIGAFAPASTCTRGQAKFSVMEPGTHVWAHCGPTNCRLRAHLGLVVPSGVFLRVAQQTESWKEGKVLVFDDSFEHEVWHNGTSVRLVLIVDVWHPELTQHEKQTLSPI